MPGCFFKKPTVTLGKVVEFNNPFVLMKQKPMPEVFVCVVYM